MVNVIVGRDIGRNYAIEVGYVGRFGRDMLVRRDLAMPLNLTDPKSGDGLLHGGAADHQGGAGRRYHRRLGGRRLRGARADSVLGEHVPGRGRRRR